MDKLEQIKMEKLILTSYWCSKCIGFHRNTTKIFMNHLNFKIPTPKNWYELKYLKECQKILKKLKSFFKYYHKIEDELSLNQKNKIIKIARSMRNHLEEQLKGGI